MTVRTAVTLKFQRLRKLWLKDVIITTAPAQLKSRLHLSFSSKKSSQAKLCLGSLNKLPKSSHRSKEKHLIQVKNYQEIHQAKSSNSCLQNQLKSGNLHQTQGRNWTGHSCQCQSTKPHKKSKWVIDVTTTRPIRWSPKIYCKNKSCWIRKSWWESIKKVKKFRDQLLNRTSPKQALKFHIFKDLWSSSKNKVRWKCHHQGKHSRKQAWSEARTLSQSIKSRSWGTATLSRSSIHLSSRRFWIMRSLSFRRRWRITSDMFLICRLIELTLNSRSIRGLPPALEVGNPGPLSSLQKQESQCTIK